MREILGSIPIWMQLFPQLVSVIYKLTDELICHYEPINFYIRNHGKAFKIYENSWDLSGSIKQSGFFRVNSFVHTRALFNPHTVKLKYII